MGTAGVWCGWWLRVWAPEVFPPGFTPSNATSTLITGRASYLCVVTCEVLGVPAWWDCVEERVWPYGAWPLAAVVFVSRSALFSCGLLHRSRITPPTHRITSCHPFPKIPGPPPPPCLKAFVLVRPCPWLCSLCCHLLRHRASLGAEFLYGLESLILAEGLCILTTHTSHRGTPSLASWLGMIAFPVSLTR